MIHGYDAISDITTDDKTAALKQMDEQIWFFCCLTELHSLHLLEKLC